MHGEMACVQLRLGPRFSESMPKFRYVAIDSREKPVRGELEAVDKADLAARLNARHLFLTYCRDMGVPSSQAPSLTDFLFVGLRRTFVGKSRRAIAPEVQPVFDTFFVWLTAANQWLKQDYRRVINGRAAYGLIFLFLTAIFLPPRSDRTLQQGLPAAAVEKIRRIQLGMTREEVETFLRPGPNFHHDHSAKKYVTRYFEPPETVIEVSYDFSPSSHSQDRVKGVTDVHSINR